MKRLIVIGITIFSIALVPSFALAMINDNFTVTAADASGNPGEQVDVSIDLTRAAQGPSDDVLMIRVDLEYDQTVITAQNLTLGTALPAGWSIVSPSFTDNTNGRMLVYLQGSNINTFTGEGQILSVRFLIDSNPPVNSSVLDLTRTKVADLEGDYEISNLIDGIFSVVPLYNITVNQSGKGAIESDPADLTQVEEGSDVTLTISPDSYYRIDDVVLDGVSVKSAVTIDEATGVGTYVLTNVTQSFTIDVEFGPHYGDANGDRSIGVADALVVLEHDALISIISDADALQAADVNPSTHLGVGMSDALLILEYDAKRITEFPVEQ